MKFVLIIIFTGALAFAEEKPTCFNPQNANEFVQCALEYHPEAQGARFDEKKADGLLKQARQFPNPQLGAEFSETDNIGQTSNTVELSLLFPIEHFGGKRGARIERSKAEADLIRFEALKKREEVAIHSLLNLYRMRQLLEEIELTEESLQTFKNVKQQYSRRKSLGPQQSVSLDIFSLAEADYSMRLSALETEKALLMSELSLTLGRPFKMDKDKLPKFKMNWPILSEEAAVIGPDIQIVKAKNRMAEGMLSEAKSEAWPELAIGPTYSAETENNDRITTVGVSIEMPLPIFNFNGGGKAVAQAEKYKAAVRENSQSKNLEFQRKNLVQTYNGIIKRLKRYNPETLGHSKHKRIHKYLKRGVVEAALVIESHRQIVEFREHTNEQELEALKALWQVRSLDGELLKTLKGEDL